MSEAPVYPTAHEVAVAIIVAARLHGEDPILSLEGVVGMRGRWLAVAALHEAFPDAPHDWIAGACGVSGRSRCQNARAEIRSKRFGKDYNRAKWFVEADLKTVKAALADAIAVTDAELRNRMGAGIDAATAAPLPDTGGDADPAPIDEPSDFSPLFGGMKSDVLDEEIADFSHLRNASNRPPIDPPTEPASPSLAAHALADFHRWRTVKTGRGRIIDHRVAGIVDMGEPLPGRSALDQREEP